MHDRSTITEELKIGISQMRRQVKELQLEHRDRQELVDSLQAMERKYRLLADNSCDIISLHSVDGNKCFYVNPAVYMLLGYSKSDFDRIDGLKIADIIYPDDRGILLNLFNDTLQNGESLEKIRYQSKNGKAIWFEVAGRMVQDEQEIPVVLLRAKDIDEQVQVEQEMKQQYEQLQQGYASIEKLNNKLQEYHFNLMEANQKLQYNEERLQLALWGAGGCLWEWNMISGKILVNDKWANIIGYSWDNEIYDMRKLLQKVHPDDTIVINDALRYYMEGKTPYFSVEARLQHARGYWIWVSITGKLVFENNQGRTVRIVGLVQDIGDQKMARENLEASEYRYRAIFENNPIGLCKIDSKGNVTDVNKALLEMVSAESKQRILEINIFDDVVHKVFPFLKDMATECKRGAKCSREINFKTRSGRNLWLWYRVEPVLDEAGHFVEAIIACQEISERKQAEDKIRYLSFNDSLTGLYNRAFYEEELKRLNTRRQLPLTIVMGDLNGLKLINDAFGHKQGDLALQKLAEVLKASCRKEDIVARIGGDEFVALLPRTSADVARDICRRIKENCKKVRTSHMELSIALGMATKENEDQNIFEIEKEAEERMYRNKLLENRSTRSSFINSLEQNLWTRGHETREHTIRLHQILAAVSNCIGLNEGEIANLKLLASLHDIGKIAIPLNILEKREKLEPDEWETIKKHPEIGYRIALSTPELAPIAEAILTHHENWDGSGYPLQINGDNIPILARILAIADAYDVMQSGRPYSEAKSKQQALDEIKKCSGSKFDPELVNIFVDEISKRDDL